MKYLFAFLLMFVFASPLITSAQATGQSGLNCSGGVCTYVPLEPLPTGNAQAQNGTNFPAFLDGFFRVLISLSGILAVLLLVIGGIGYMVSEALPDINVAKGRIKNALWGLLIIMGSWLILNTINPKLIQLQLNTSGSATTPVQNSSVPATQSATASQLNGRANNCEPGGTVQTTQSGGTTCVPITQ